MAAFSLCGGGGEAQALSTQQPTVKRKRPPSSQFVLASLPAGWQLPRKGDDDDDDHHHHHKSGQVLSSKSNPAGRNIVLVCLGTILAIVIMIMAVQPRPRNTISNNNDYDYDDDIEFLTAADYAALFAPGRPNGQACYTAADCLAGSMCAFPSWHNNSVRICCSQAVPVASQEDNTLRLSSLSSFSWHNPENSNDRQDRHWLQPAFQPSTVNSVWLLSVCTGAALGEACGQYHEICASGHCRDGVCVETAAADGELCQQDSDCQSGACAFVEYNLHDDPRCCPTTTTTTTTTTTGSAAQSSSSSSSSIRVSLDPLPYEISLCTRAPVGTRCGKYDAMCASGWCSQGMCRNPNTRRRSFPP